MPAGKDGHMTELRQIIGVINGLNEVEQLEAQIGEWHVEIMNRDWRDQREITFTKPLPKKDEEPEEPEAEPEEAAIDDLPFA